MRSSQSTPIRPYVCRAMALSLPTRRAAHDAAAVQSIAGYQTEPASAGSGTVPSR
jgi:hypothetical protein